MAVALHWALNLSPSSSSSPLPLLTPPMTAAVLAAIATKRAALLAFAEKGRATTSPDLLEQLGAAVQQLEEGMTD